MSAKGNVSARLQPNFLTHLKADMNYYDHVLNNDIIEQAVQNLFPLKQLGT